MLALADLRCEREWRAAAESRSLNISVEGAYE